MMRFLLVCLFAIHAQVGGVLGESVDSAFAGRLTCFITGSDSPAIRLFEEENFKADGWRGEHAGKWLYAASNAVIRTGDDTLRTRLVSVADYLLSRQDARGWLGCNLDGTRFYDSPGGWHKWDIWINTYMMKGLVACTRATGDVKYLDAAARIADLMYETFIIGGVSLPDTGHHDGMVALGSIDPLADLYSVRPDPQYKALIDLCVKEMDSFGGLGLIQKSLSGADVSTIGNGKIYEMLRCLTGLAKVYRITGEGRLLSCCEKAWTNIRTAHLNPCGGPWGGINVHRECFDSPGCSPFAGICETCSSMEWFHLCSELLDITHDGRYAEEMEKTAYNALAGARSGKDWVYYTRLDGDVTRGNEWSCCWSSGMIAMEDIPAAIFSRRDDGIAVNIYSPASAEMISVDGSFPEGPDLDITVHKRGRYAVYLRVPEYSADFAVSSRHRDVTSADGYLRVYGRWRKGEKIRVSIPLDKSEISISGDDGRRVAKKRGPLVLAYGPDGKYFPFYKYSEMPGCDSRSIWKQR